MEIDILNKLNTRGSGLNLSEITNGLVDAEIVPKQSRVQEGIAKSEASISALSSLRGQLDTLDSALNIASHAKALLASSSDPAVSVEVTNAALMQEQKSEINVFQIAQGQVLDFKGLNSGADTISGGTLQIDFGVWHGEVEPQSFTVNGDLTGQTLEIEAGTTLDEVAAQLNEMEGISARIIRVGDGTFSLGIVSDVGSASALRITATPSGAPTAEQMDLTMFDTTVTNHEKQIQEATNAMLSVDGITVFRTTNEIDDILPGVTLTLKSETEFPVDISVTSDVGAAKDTMKALLQHLNDTTQMLNELTKRGLDGAPAGPLAGDPTATALKRQLENLKSGALVGFSEQPIFLSQLGVRTERNGTLTLDERAFDAAFNKDPMIYEAVFGNALRADVEGVSIDRGPTTGATPGVYAFERDPDTGAATFGGIAMTEVSSENGTTIFSVASGPMAGLRLSVLDGVNSAQIQNGQSYVSKLQDQLDDTLSFVGPLSKREDALSTKIGDYMNELTELNELSDKLQKRYIEKFSAMESMITRMKSTGEYLTNLIAQWNKDD